MKNTLYALVIILVSFSCQNDSNQEHGHDHNDHSHNHSKTSQAETQISFQRKQSSTSDFAIEKVNEQDIYNVIHTSGNIEAMQGDEQIITAKTTGIILFNNDKTVIGKRVNTSQALCTISGQGLTENNIEAQFIVAKAEFEKDKAAYERGAKLIASKVIAQSQFEELKAKMKISSTKYLTLKDNYSAGGKVVKAPFNGFIKNILVREGQHVKSGDPLMTVSKNEKLIIKAEVSQKYFSDLPLIHSVNFKTAYGDKIYSMEEFNGKLISYGKNVNSSSNYLPVYFEIDNKGKLLPGAFIEVYLKGKTIPNALTVPEAALLEDYDNRFVYVRTSQDTYEKRDVMVGVCDGINIQILSGVRKGEWVVSKGAYQIKLSATKSTIPSHGHNH
jgi:cobalt-zinc-cadmium efflux system membrane fusion protein